MDPQIMLSFLTHPSWSLLNRRNKGFKTSVRSLLHVLNLELAVQPYKGK